MKFFVLITAAIFMASTVDAKMKTTARYKMQLPTEAYLRNFVGQISNQGFSLEVSQAPLERPLENTNDWLRNLDLNEIRRRLETLTFTSEVSQYTLKNKDNREIFSKSFTSTIAVEQVPLAGSYSAEPQFFMSAFGIIQI